MSDSVCRTRTNGQALLEFALVVPLLLFMVIGLFDLGYAVFSANLIGDAAREGARVGIIKSKTDTDIRTRVKAAAPGLGLTDPQIRIRPSPNRTFNNPITVTVTYTYTPLTPLVGNIIGGGLPLSATSVMIVEGVIEY